MIFASPIFLLVFLPVVLLGYFLTPQKLKNVFLLLASIVFYSWGAPKFIFAILLTTTIDFYLAKTIEQSSNERKRKLFLILSILMNLGFLFYFKYFNFFVENINCVLQSLGTNEILILKIILPIGISFYTFESITYLVDVYRRVHKPLNNFWDYQLYILFFPKLIAGPITRYHEIADQITNRFTANNLDNILTGFIRFCLGLAKKVLIANTMGQFADSVFDTPLKDINASVAWIGSLAYTFQIYFDFAGYSDMALGLAKLFGFTLPENFDNPYTSKSITEFWRRWHMTLGNWMKNYLYIPLGGNKVKTSSRLYFNLFVIFIVSGFWHGANWNFILWGVAHGLFMVIERLFLMKYLEKIPKFLSLLYAFLIVNFAWVLFRGESFEQSLAIYKAMFSFEFSNLGLDNAFKFYFVVTILASGMALFSHGRKLQNYFYTPKLNLINSFILIGVSFVLFTISLGSIVGSGFNPFIYFRF